MKVEIWGDDLAVRLPEKLVKEMGLEAGDEIEIVRSEAGRIEVEKSDRRAEALKRMADRNWEVPPGYKFDRDEANER